MAWLGNGPWTAAGAGASRGPLAKAVKGTAGSAEAKEIKAARTKS